MAESVTMAEQNGEEKCVSNGQAVPTMATLSCESVNKESKKEAVDESKVVGNDSQPGQNGISAPQNMEETTSTHQINGDKNNEESKSGNDTTINGVVESQCEMTKTVPVQSEKPTEVETGAESKPIAKKGRGRPAGTVSKPKKDVVEAIQEESVGLRRSGRNVAKRVAVPVQNTKGKKKIATERK